MLLTTTSCAKVTGHSRGRPPPLPQALAAVYMPVAQRPADRGDKPGSWHAQALQDRVVLKVHGGKRAGFFVDAAANHPSLLSSTRSLERDYGWRGVCVEPQESLWRLLAARRCVCVGAFGDSCEATAVIAAESPLGSLRPPILLWRRKCKVVAAVLSSDERVVAFEVQQSAWPQHCSLPR